MFRLLSKSRFAKARMANATFQQRANKALHPTALVPRSLPAAGELSRSAVACGLAGLEDFHRGKIV